jgi:hypothetical protein
MTLAPLASLVQKPTRRRNIPQLLPRLHTGAGEGPLPHPVLIPLRQSRRRVPLGLPDGHDFFPLGHNQRIFRVPTSLDLPSLQPTDTGNGFEAYLGQDLDRLLVPSHLCEPPRAAGQERRAGDEQDRGHQLDAPRQPEAMRRLVRPPELAPISCQRQAEQNQPDPGAAASPMKNMTKIPNSIASC